MKIPNPWGDNKLDSKFKSFIEELRQFTISVFNKSEDDYKRLNKRVSNLVISSCENNDNEVKDARTDIDGTMHESLYDHIIWSTADARSKNDEQDNQIKEVNNDLEILNNTMKILFDKETESTNIYVSKERGSDENGDGTEEKPFYTVQKAIDTIPIISVSSYFVILDKGSYKEDIIISNKIATSIEIKSYNNEIVNALENENTGVFIRSATAKNTTAYVAFRGLSIIDTANSPGYAIYADRVKYVTVNNMSIKENTKNKANYVAISMSASNGNILGNLISNQKSVLTATFTSSFIFNSQNIGENNESVLTSSRSIIYKSGTLNVKGTNELVKVLSGQIFE